MELEHFELEKAILAYRFSDQVALSNAPAGTSPNTSWPPFGDVRWQGPRHQTRGTPKMALVSFRFH